MRRPSHHCWGNKIPCLLFVGVTVRRKSIFKGQKQAFKDKLTSLGCWTPTPLTYDSVQKYVLWSLFMMEKGLLGLFLKCRLDPCKVSVENSGGKCRRWNSWGPTSFWKDFLFLRCSQTVVNGTLYIFFFPPNFTSKQITFRVKRLFSND